MPAITINGVTIDTSAPKKMLSALSLSHDTAKDSDYLLVQTKSPLNQKQRDALAKVGATILEAVPGDAFICHFPKTELGKVRALDFVAWADLYPQGVKVGPALRDLPTPKGGMLLSAMSLAAPAALESTPKTVDVVLHGNADVNTAVKKIAEAAHLSTDQVKVAGQKIRLTMKSRRLEDVAALDEVRHIEEVVPRKLHNSVARKILRAASSSPAPGNEGLGEVVAVADTGFDKGSTTDVHPAFTGRVKKLYALGRSNRKDDPDGHGTHVAGSVLGDGTSSKVGAVRGTATAAKLVLQSLLDSGNGLGGIPDNLNDLFITPYKADKARTHTNSWGSVGNFGMYDQQAREVDQFVHDHRDMLICFAAGNEGVDANANGQIDPNSVTPPGTAKNCLTVGACENLRPDKLDTYGESFRDYPANPIHDDPMANNPDGMVAFSSRGPTHDGRIKPDIVAPGTWVLSSRSRATKSTGWGASADPLYMFDGGTSMATPLVAGGTAVVRAFLKTTHKLKKPSAALIKAMIINGAHVMTGQYSPSEAGAIPNSNQGFGRMDLQAVVGPYGPTEQLQFFDEATALDTGEKFEKKITVPAGTKLLKATLVWTDPPGEGLQSDLDLIVVAGAVERHGNMAPNSTAFDRVNNVEQVAWTDIPAGSITVRVIANRTTLAAQNFALVVRTA